MKDRGKGIAAVQLAFNDGDPFSLPETIPCRDHPRSSNVGICAYCLKDRLLNLVCSECGEQRLSSCSCSDDLSSNRNSCAHDVGSVGRVSFLIENEKQGEGQSGAGRGPRKSFGVDKPEEVVVLRRSSSSCVESRRSGIWRVGKLFLRGKKKKRSEENDGGGGGNNQGQSGGDCSKNELWVFDEAPVTRSRSLRSFSRARTSSVNGNPGPADSDRRSCFSEAEMRRSGFSDTEMRKSCFSETDGRKSAVLEGGVDPDVPRLNRRIFSLRESDYFGGMDERNFIDLRFCSTAAESKAEDWPGKGPTGEGGELRSGSCRVRARDRVEIKKSKSFMGWRWKGFRNHHQTQLQNQ